MEVGVRHCKACDQLLIDCECDDLDEEAPAAEPEPDEAA